MKNEQLNEELLKRADQIINSVGEAASKAGTFAMEQLPDIAQQFIIYGRVTSTVYMALGLTLGIVGIWGAVKVTRTKNDAYVLLAFVPSLLGPTILAMNTNDFIMSWFAPKLFLITQLVHLLK